MTKNNYFVLTGAMGAGKTTVIEVLREMNILCIEEPARVILKEQRSINGDGVPDKDPALFNHLMLLRMIEQYTSNARTNEFILFDRGIPDIVAYSELLNTSTEEPIIASKAYRYNAHVFLMSGWKDIYANDEERKVDFETANEFGKCVRRIYEELDYSIIEVPFVSALERAVFVVNSIEKIVRMSNS